MKTPEWKPCHWLFKPERSTCDCPNTVFYGSWEHANRYLRTMNVKREVKLMVIEAETILECRH